MKVLFGVTGSIAVLGLHGYLARLVAEPGVEVSAVMTRTAAQIVNPAALGAVLRTPVLVDAWSDGQGRPPTGLVAGYDVLVVAPASATTLAWCAQGAAANIVAASYLACTERRLFAPAMAPEMLRHPAVRRNLAMLREDGALVLPCAQGFQVSSGEWCEGAMCAYADLRAALDGPAGGLRMEGSRRAVHGAA